MLEGRGNLLQKGDEAGLGYAGAVVGDKGGSRGFFFKNLFFSPLLAFRFDLAADFWAF